MKKIKQCIVLVDSNRKPWQKHSTAGRYRTGAKTAKEAEELVRKTIQFGSVRFYYFDTRKNTYQAKYKEVVKETETGIIQPHKAADNYNSWDKRAKEEDHV